MTKKKPEKGASVNVTRSRRERKREYLEPEEINRLLEVARTGEATRNPVRDYALLLVTFLHGLRASELCNLRVSDVDLKRRVLYVPRLKNGKPAEHPIKAAMQKPFRAHNELRAAQEWLAVRESMKPETDHLFISEQRRGLSRQNVALLVGKIAEAAGLGKLAVHGHMLRHSLGYHLVNKGVNIRVVQEYLGHRRIESTVIYTAINPARFNEIL
jgi:type 1 fimbriae regulatory protein FimB